MKRSYDSWLHRMVRFAFGSVIPLVVWCSLATAQSQPDQPELNDVHFHLTNYIQEGTDIHEFLKIMGTKVGRVALFGIPFNRNGHTRILETLLRPTTCRRMHRSITTPSPMPTLRWRTDRSRESSGRASIP